MLLATTSVTQIINNSERVVMHIRKYLSIFLIGFVFVVAGCSGGSSSSGSVADNLEREPDTDNDGIADTYDFDTDDGPTPGLICTSAKIIAPSDEALTGSTVTVRWELLPEGCGVTQGGLFATSAEAVARNKHTWSASVSPGRGWVSIEIPHDCGWHDGGVKRQNVEYDISQIVESLGQGVVSEFNYQQTISHQILKCPGVPVAPINPIIDGGQPDVGTPIILEPDDWVDIPLPLPLVPTPPCDSAVITWPDGTALAGSKVEIKWTFLPNGCALNKVQSKESVASSATQQGTTTSGEEVLVRMKTVSIEVPCASHNEAGTFRDVDYVLDLKSLGEHKETITHPEVCAD